MRRHGFSHPNTQRNAFGNALCDAERNTVCHAECNAFGHALCDSERNTICHAECDAFGHAIGNA
jgi:hypothetical protein